MRRIDPLPAGLLGGVGSAIAARNVDAPYMGFDGSTYHSSTTVAWAQSGSVFDDVPTLHDFATGAYPLADQALLVLPTTLAGGFVPMMVWPVVAAGLLAAASWTAIRAFGAARLPAGLAIAAVLLTPVAAAQLAGPGSDLSAAAWLSASVALAAAHRATGDGVPARLALLACGLAVATKWSVLAPALAVAGVVLMRVHRDGDRRPATIAAGLVAVWLAGLVPLTNLVEHGAPFWPFQSAPWGDARPPIYEVMSVSLIERPVGTLEGRTLEYRVALRGGTLIVLAAVPLLVVAVRRGGTVLRVAAAGAGLLLLWAAAPVTGAVDDPRFGFFTISALRYMVPALLALAAALVLLAGRTRAGLVASAVLALALAEDLRGLWYATTPDQVDLRLLAGGAAGGVLAAGLLVRAPRARVPALVAATAVAGAFLVPRMHDALPRHAATGFYDAELVRWWAGRTDRRPVAVSPWAIGMLAGDRLEHEVRLIPAGEGCARTRARLQEGWVVVTTWARGQGYPERRSLLTDGRAFACVRDLPAAFDDGRFRVIAPQPVARRRIPGSVGLRSAASR